MKHMNRWIARCATVALVAAFTFSAAPRAFAQDHAAAEPEKLPAGMTGSSLDDPRAHLKPGMFDAEESAMGLKHLTFVKKPKAFTLDSEDPNDPSVARALSTLGIPAGAKIPDNMKLVLAGLAFANSDFAFQGNHLFQGNFYGISIWDIKDPAKTSLLTTLVCPGGQGDVSVYGNLMFMSVEMPNGRVDCGAQAFPPNPPPAAGHEHDRQLPAASKDRFRGVRDVSIFRTSPEPEAGGCSADVSRVAYAYAGRRSEGQGQRLHLRFGHVVCAPERRARRLRSGGEAGQECGHGAVPD